MQTDKHPKTAKILVIEDDADLRTLLRLALKADNYEIEVVGSAYKAIAILETGRIPSLILTDLSLPELSGEDFVKYLRSNHELKGIKIVVMSGWDDLGKKARALGADGWIEKPLDLGKLSREIEMHLSSHAHPPDERGLQGGPI